MGFEGRTCAADLLPIEKAAGRRKAPRRLRSSELKHGRFVLMATIGCIRLVTLGHLPGCLPPSASLRFSDTPDGLGAISKVPNSDWVQILLFASMTEFGLGPDGTEEWKTRPAGDYGEGYLGIGPVTDAGKKERSLSSELADGRLAVAAIAGMMLQNGITGATGYAMWSRPARSVQA